MRLATAEPTVRQYDRLGYAGRMFNTHALETCRGQLRARKSCAKKRRGSQPRSSAFLPRWALIRRRECGALYNAADFDKEGNRAHSRSTRRKREP